MKQYLNKQNILGLINSQLDESIRIFALKRVTNSFDMKKNTRSRIYEYIIPVRAFHPYKELKEDEEKPKITDDEYEKIHTKLMKIIKKFEGTHDFHNYTLAKKADSHGTQRFIKSMSLEKLDRGILEKMYPEKKDTIEDYFKITLHGQSFIYHQIRKMVGMAVQLFQEDMDLFVMDNAFLKNKFPIWLAPSEGLLLDRLTFEGYNMRSDIPESLEFEESELAALTEFKHRVIYKEVIDSQEERGVFDEWLKQHFRDLPVSENDSDK